MLLTGLHNDVNGLAHEVFILYLLNYYPYILQGLYHYLNVEARFDAWKHNNNNAQKRIDHFVDLTLLMNKNSLVRQHCMILYP